MSSQFERTASGKLIMIQCPETFTGTREGLQNLIDEFNRLVDQRNKANQERADAFALRDKTLTEAMTARRILREACPSITSPSIVGAATEAAEIVHAYRKAVTEKKLDDKPKPQSPRLCSCAACRAQEIASMPYDNAKTATERRPDA